LLKEVVKKQDAEGAIEIVKSIVPTYRMAEK
jgi:hypothetical protein